MAVDSVVGWAWNGWTNQRGITGRMTVERVVEWAWNTHAFFRWQSGEQVVLAGIVPLAHA